MLDNVEWQPTYLPEGFEESDALVFSMLTRIEYTNEDGAVIIFSVMTAEGSSVAVDNENSYYYTSISNGIEYYVFTATDKDIPTNVIWEYDGLVFSINALFDDDELLKMAFSTQKD